TVAHRHLAVSGDGTPAIVAHGADGGRMECGPSLHHHSAPLLPVPHLFRHVDGRDCIRFANGPVSCGCKSGWSTNWHGPAIPARCADPLRLPAYASRRNGEAYGG